jgi:hypothetical protein
MPDPDACAMARRDSGRRERNRDDVVLIRAVLDHRVRTVSFRFAMVLHLPRGEKKGPAAGLGSRATSHAFSAGNS